MVCPLPQDLDRRLCAVLFFGWHVQVVYKYDTFLTDRSSICTTLPSDKNKANADYIYIYHFIK
jgi:hypothetical protein